MTKYKLHIIFLLGFLALNNCGYTPIFSSGNVTFQVVETQVSGDKKVGNRFAKALKRTKIKSPDLKEVYLDIFANKDRTIATKNEKGETQTYKLNISITIQAKFLDAEKYFSTETLSNSINFEKQDKESENLILENKNMNDIISKLSQNYIVRLNQILN